MGHTITLATRKMLVKQLQTSHVLDIIPGCKHGTFPKPINRLHTKPNEDIISWIKNHL